MIAEMPSIKSLPSVHVNERRSLPTISAIYFVLRGDVCVYVGRTRNLKARWANHNKLPDAIEANALIAWMPAEVGNLVDFEGRAIEHFAPDWNDEPGRPELPENERRKPVMIRLNEAERRRYERAAAKANTSLAGWLRWAADLALSNGRRA